MSDNHKGDGLVRVEHELAPPRQLHPVVEAAMSRGVDPATWRELLAVQREWEAGEAKKAYDRGMIALKRDLPAVLARDKRVDFTSKRTGDTTSYTHTSLAAAVDAVIMPLTNHGFSHSWTPQTNGKEVTVTCRLTHCEGHSEQCTLSSAPDNSGLKSPAQAVASTITLLQRYSLLSLLGIATSDMKDPPPQRESRPDAVDQARNLRAAAALRNYGKTSAEACEYLGRPVADWTSDDLQKLGAWLRGEQDDEPSEDPNPPVGEHVPPEQPEQPPEREPGDDSDQEYVP